MSCFEAFASRQNSDSVAVAMYRQYMAKGVWLGAVAIFKVIKVIATATTLFSY